MNEYICPECGSENVLIGVFVLSCCTCGWDHNNKYPCSVCGKPSFGCGGSESNGIKVILYGCKEHPVTMEAINTLYAKLKAEKETHA